MKPQKDLMRMSDVQVLTGLSRFELFRLPGFPRPFRRGAKVLGWEREAVTNWVMRKGK